MLRRASDNRDNNDNASGPPDAPHPLGQPTRAHWLLPIALILLCGFIGMRYEVLGRGGGLLLAYPIAVVIQTMFGMLALFAAMGILNMRWQGFWLATARVAAVYVTLDAVRSFTFEWPLGTVAIQAAALLVLILVLFRFRLAVLLFIGSILFLIKMVSRQVIEETLYTWF